MTNSKSDENQLVTKDELEQKLNRNLKSAVDQIESSIALMDRRIDRLDN
jgi:hypothetical protein